MKHQFAVTFVDTTGKSITRKVFASCENKAILLVEQFGYSVESCIKIA